MSLQYLELYPPLDCRTNSSKESKTTILATAAASSADCKCNTYIPVPSLFLNSRSIIVCSCQKPAISDCWKLGFCTKPGQFQLCIEIFQSIICLGTGHESDDTHTTSIYNRGPPPLSSGGQQKNVYVWISSYSSYFSRGPGGWENLGTHHRQGSCCFQKELHS